MDGQPPDESNAVVAQAGVARPRPFGTNTDELITTILKLLARQVAREIIEAAEKRP